MNYRDFPLLGGKYQYPVWERAMEVAAIAIYVSVAALLGYEVMHGAKAMLDERISGGELGVWALVVGVPLFAYLAADVASGLVHCAADNIGNERTPIFGPAFIKPFRDHHRDPKDITAHDFVEANGNSCLINLFVLIPTFLFVPVAQNGFALVWGLFILFFTAAITMTNQVHKWAHTETPPPIVAALQRSGLILTKGVHQVHHTVPFNRYYCITNGWMNPLLDKLRLFELLVKLVKGA